MSDVNISKFRAQVIRTGSTPASPGFVVSEGQNPVDPSGSGQTHLPVTIATASTGLSITESQILSGAGLVSQYIRGDGSLADFPPTTGGGSSVSYYLNGSVSQGTIGGVAYKELNRTPVFGAGTDISISADGYIASFITDALDPNKLLIPAGNWNFETYFSANSSGGSPSFYIELYKYNGTTFTLIATSSAAPELIAFGTNLNPYFSTLAVPETVLALTDRLALRYYVTHSGRTITLHTENGHLCEVITTFTTGLTALNGLTNQVQFFAVGTSGTDFAISSVTDTHTFNLPTASATNRGALSSADWTTFNNKTSNVGTVTSVAATAGTGISVSGSPITTSGTLTITNTAPDQVVALTASTGISVSGTYPNFTITNTSPSSGGTVTSVGLSSATSGVTIGSSPVTTSGTITLAIATASGSLNGLLSSTDWTTFNGKQNALNGTGFVKISGTTISYDNTNYLPLTGGTLTGQLNGTSIILSGDITANRYRGVNSLVLNTYTTVNPASNVYLYSPGNDRDAWVYLDSADTGSNWGIYHRQIDSAVSGLPANSIGFIGAGTNTLQAWISLANGNGFFAGDLTANNLSGTNTGNVTIGTANGLSLSTQVLSLGLASAGVTGALSGTDWTTFNGKQNALTNPVTGTGTTNYLPKFTGASTIGNSQIFDNGSGVGINTATPYTATNFTFVTTNNTSGSGYVTRVNGTLSALIYSSASGTIISEQRALPLILETTGSERMRITSGGNVGIGTPSPESLSNNTTLQIDGTNHSFVRTGSSNYGGYFATIPTAEVLCIANVRNPVTGTYNNTGKAASGINLFSQSSNGYIEFLTTATNNSSPSVRLTIASTGAATFSSSVTATKTAKNTYGIQIAGAFYGAPRLQVYDLAADPNGYMGLGTDMSTAPYELSNYFPRTSGLGRWSVGSWAGDFGTGQYVSGYNEKLFITESAAQFNVPLTVTSSVTAGGSFISSMGNNTTIFSSSAATTGYQIMTLTNSGAQLNMGINNSAGSFLTGSSAYASFISTGLGSTSLQLGTNNSIKITILSDGNVGIGTIAPATKFHVESASVSYGQLRFLNTASSGETSINIGRTNQTLEQRWTVGQGVAGIGDSFGFYTGGSSRVNLQTNGNFLIGTTSDSGDKLRVNGTTFSNEIMTLFPEAESRSGINWRFGAASIASITPNRRLRVKVGGVEYYIGAVEV